MSNSLTVIVDENTLARLQAAAAGRAMTAEAVAEMAGAVFLDHEDLDDELDRDAVTRNEPCPHATGNVPSDDGFESVVSKSRLR